VKRLVVGILTVLAILATAGIGAEAAPDAVSSQEIGPYEGRFDGFAYGDRASKAPLTLELTHRGRQVEGRVLLGEGLYVSGGFCGAVDLPATAQYVEGHTLTWDPKRLEVTPTFDLGGFDLSVDFQSEVSADGKVITAKAKVDLPWFCGRDPVLSGILYRE
jgi:hypothetical protein